MTVYLLQWTDSESDFPAKRLASSSYKEVDARYKDIVKAERPAITILDREDAISKVSIKNQQDVINLINSLV